MIVSFIIALVAISISVVAAYYSIAGLAAIFAAAVIPIIVMGVVLEVGKIASVIWLHLNWKRAPFLMKAYLIPSIFALMFITSMGIYGFLSKAHIDQEIDSGDNLIQIAQLDTRIQREQARIDNSESVLKQLDGAVDALIAFDRIRGPTGSIATREIQKDERKTLSEIIDQAQDKIAVIQINQTELKMEQNLFEAEVGPVKYIAALLYDHVDTEVLEKSVRYVIMIIVLVFDPLAIILILAATAGFRWAKEDKEKKSQDQVEPNVRELLELEMAKSTIVELEEQLNTPVEVTKEVIKEVPVEVIKEVIKEVPVEVTKEIIKEVPVEVIKEVFTEIEIPILDTKLVKRYENQIKILEEQLVEKHPNAKKTVISMQYKITLLEERIQTMLGLAEFNLKDAAELVEIRNRVSQLEQTITDLRQRIKNAS